MRPLYVTYQENIVGSGILHTQVVRMLEKLGNLKGVEEITLLSFLSPQLMFKEWRRIEDLRERLYRSNVKLIVLPMFFPASWKLPWSLPLLLWSLPVAMISMFSNSDVIHSRGYAAGLISAPAASVQDIPSIFDPRGPYPDELVMNEIWSETSITKQFWSWVEDKLIVSSDAVIGVTPEYRDEFRQRGARLAYFVPNRTEVARFYAAADKVLNAEISSGDKCELLFIGELHAVWNSPHVVGKQFSALNRHYPNATLRMITTADSSKAKRILANEGVDLKRVTFERHRPEDMPVAMQGATFGLIMRAINIHSIWSVKIAEYLAAGIPIIADVNMVGLPLEIIERERLGLVIDPVRDKGYEEVAEVLADWPEWSRRCRDYAARRLDILSTAKQHRRIYRMLLNT